MKDLLSSAPEPIFPFPSTIFDDVTKCRFLVLAGMPVVLGLLSRYVTLTPPKELEAFPIYTWSCLISSPRMAEIMIVREGTAADQMPWLNLRKPHFSSSLSANTTPISIFYMWVWILSGTGAGTSWERSEKL